MHCELQAALATETLQAGSTLNQTQSAPKIRKLLKQVFMIDYKLTKARINILKC